MTFSIPSSRSEIKNNMITSVQAAAPELNPFLKGSQIEILITAFSGQLFEIYKQMKLLLNEIPPITASLEFLEMWGLLKGITRNPASKSTGFITVEGTTGVVIPASTEFNSQDGNAYTNQIESTVSTVTQNITITRIGSTATATTPSPHQLASNINVTISGATQAQYNGTFQIIVISNNKFTFQVVGLPATPATGSISYTTEIAVVFIQSQESGESTNQGNGIAINVTNPITNLSNTGYVQFGQLAGGTDEETDDELRARVVDAFQNPIALFNIAAIDQQAKRVPGVTKVFVKPTTPEPGQVTVYFIRGNDDNIIPTGTEITEVKNKIFEIAPVNLSFNDIIVLAPTPITVNFSFTSITPNTSTMRQSIIQNLKEFFNRTPDVGQNLSLASISAAIINTVDLATGDVLEAFSLSTPNSDISVSTGEFPVLGIVNFA